MADPISDAELAATARVMLMDLARRLGEQGIVIAKEGGKLSDAGRNGEAWKALGRATGYQEAAAQVLLIAKNL